MRKRIYDLEVYVEMWVALAIFLATLVLVHWYRISFRYPCANFPPGPIGFPFIGCPSLMTGDILEKLDKLHDKYGDVISVNLGPMKKAVVIGDYEVLKEAFKDDKTSSRGPQLQWFKDEARFGDGKTGRGLFFSDGEEWYEQRRIVNRRLRQNPAEIDELIELEFKRYAEVIEANLGQPVSVEMATNLAVSNTIWAILTGKSFSLDSPELGRIVGAVRDLFKHFSWKSPSFIFPPARHVFPELSKYNHLMRSSRAVDAILDEVLANSKRAFAENPDAKRSDPDNFVDAFLAKMDDSRPGSSFHGRRGHESLSSTLNDMLLAGFETTSTLLLWAYMKMIEHPDWQARVREEIRSVVGMARPVAPADRPNLPVTEATYQEVCRHSKLTALGVPHYTLVDVRAGGYAIPKDTTILYNFSRLLTDPKAFPDPDAFDPARFLDEEGRYRKIPQNSIFGVGKRICPGEPVANKETFLFFAGVMQRFRLSATSEKFYDWKRKPPTGLVNAPPPFEVVFTRCDDEI